MLLAAASILFGFIVLIWSADLFVDGAASIARNLGMSPIIIGLTIVSLGTSAPEILVSVNATLSGAGSLAIGNAIGSNIANIALVFGVTVLVAPLMVHENCMKKEVPILLAVTIWAGWLLRDEVLSAREGWMMIGVLVLIGWLAMTAGTGTIMGLGLSNSPELVEWLHEAFAESLPLIIIVHVAGVLASSVLHKENLIKAMINGKKRRRD